MTRWPTRPKTCEHTMRGHRLSSGLLKPPSKLGRPGSGFEPSKASNESCISLSTSRVLHVSIKRVLCKSLRRASIGRHSSSYACKHRHLTIFHLPGCRSYGPATNTAIGTDATIESSCPKSRHPEQNHRAGSPSHVGRQHPSCRQQRCC